MGVDELIARLDLLSEEFSAEIRGLADEQAIRDAQARFLGKKGRVTQAMKQVRDLDPADRPRAGAAANRVKEAIARTVATRLEELSSAELERELARSIDVTLPGRRRRLGHEHLLSQVQSECVSIFAELGFERAEGTQIETDFHCFEALAIPKDHPARDMQDTFYIDDEIVLRPHTSPVQIRTMQSQQPPVKIVAPGVVYRRDDDPTHSPMFMQIEGLLVDHHVRFTDLKGVLLYFVQRFFGKSLQIRLRPSYFPFVEPGTEVDMQCAFCTDGAASCRICKGTGWVEIAGAGMVDPAVFEHVGYDPEAYTGFAFGMGIERMAMLRHEVDDIKHFYSGDTRFLEQF